MTNRVLVVRDSHGKGNQPHGRDEGAGGGAKEFHHVGRIFEGHRAPNSSVLPVVNQQKDGHEER